MWQLAPTLDLVCFLQKYDDSGNLIWLTFESILYILVDSQVKQNLWDNKPRSLYLLFYHLT